MKPLQRPQICRSEDTYKIFLQTWDKDKLEFIEQAKLMLLNRCNRFLGILGLFTGGVAGTIGDKIVLVAALKANASSIVLAHNHPPVV